MQFLLDKINAVAMWLFGLVTWVVQHVWDLLLEALATVLAAIPVPDWLANAPSAIGAMPDSVAYVCQAFMVPQGIAIVVGAYTIRFLIRRIPLIG